MTHLRIELNNILENVSSAVIEKLYELVTSGTLDNSSHLAGNIHTTGTYLYYIDGIRSLYSDLTISADTIYLYFADPEVRSVMATLFGNGTDISISDLVGVTAIPLLLFRNNSLISTFNELNDLRGITILGNYSFNGSSITLIGLNNITTILAGVFGNCTSLLSASLPNLTLLGDNCFYGCTSLTTVLFGGQITSLPSATCRSNSSLTSVSGLLNIISTSNACFYDCRNLQSIDIDSSKLITIGEYCFTNCTSLTFDGNFTNLTTLDRYAFQGCKFTNGLMNLPKILSIGDLALRQTNLVSIDLSNSTITTIPYACFYGCTSLTSISLPNTITSFSGEAFRDCSSLTSIVLPNSQSINLADGVFYGCSSLSTITGLTNNFSYIGHCCLTGCPVSLTGVVTTSSSIIGRDALYLKTGITKIILTANSVSLYNFALASCSGLTEILGTDKITKISAGSFKGCSGLTGTLDLSNVDGTVPNNRIFGAEQGGFSETFSKCSGLRKIIIGHINYFTSSNYSTEAGTFNECSSLEILDIGLLDTIYINANGIFRQCSLLHSIILRCTTVPTITMNVNRTFTINELGGSGVRIYVPDAAINDYKSALYWSDISTYIYPISLFSTDHPNE